MMAGNADKPLPAAVDVNMDRLLATSLLIQGFPPLPSADLMAANESRQLDERADGRLVDTSTVIFGSKTIYALNDPTSLDVIDQQSAIEAPSVTPSPSPTPTPRPTPTPSPNPTATPSPTPTATPTPSPTPTATPTPSPTPTATPTPTPSPTATPTPSPSPSATPTPSATPSPTPQPTPQKFGTPPVIVSQVPFVINSTTTIQTDPIISQAGGATGEGRIYRGPNPDGAFSTWAFTATSAFDTASGIDSHFGNAANLQLAAFKFVNLQLAGDPIISTANGGATKLALLTVGSITAQPGASFRFAGVDTVLLATQNGSINLSGIGFQNIGQLYFYARGLTSDLILGATISGVGTAILQAERDAQVNAPLAANDFSSYVGRDFLAGSGPVTAAAIDIRAGRDINFNLARYAVGGSAGHTIRLVAAQSVNIDAGASRTAFTRAGLIFVNGNTINVSAIENETFVFEINTFVTFQAGPGGFIAPLLSFDHLAASNPFDITSAGEIMLRGIIGVDNLTAGTSFRASELVITQTLTSGTFIQTGSDLTALGFVSAGEDHQRRRHVDLPSRHGRRQCHDRHRQCIKPLFAHRNPACPHRRNRAFPKQRRPGCPAHLHHRLHCWGHRLQWQPVREQWESGWRSAYHFRRIASLGW